MIPVER